MATIYVIIENGDPYPIAYTSFSSAISVVKEKYKEIVEDDEIDVSESNTGKTYLYIEKGIHIYICKLPVL